MTVSQSPPERDAAAARPGNFVNIKVNDLSFPLLRRPFSVYRVDGETIEVLFHIVGSGTAILAGARAGLIAPDDTTFSYLKGRDNAPTGADWDAAVADWKTLVTDDGAKWDKEVVIDAPKLTPQVTWGTNPGQGVPLDATVPGPDDFSDPSEKLAAEKALAILSRVGKRLGILS